MTTQSTTHSERTAARIAEIDELALLSAQADALEALARELAAKLDAIIDEIEPDREPPYYEDGMDARMEWEFRSKAWERIRAILEAK